MPKHTTWTKQEDITLLGLMAKGMPVAEAVEIMGRPYTGIGGRARILGGGGTGGKLASDPAYKRKSKKGVTSPKLSHEVSLQLLKERMTDLNSIIRQSGLPLSIKVEDVGGVKQVKLSIEI